MNKERRERKIIHTQKENEKRKEKRKYIALEELERAVHYLLIVQDTFRRICGHRSHRGR